ncbi:CsgG/HfaB family protein [Cerasicoccus frondis]|uniref:CsgG/HfaB family protein n=1 Tax=Cerasicoccus frondis TaxID=490090 RepID=UPI00285296EB|nr:CsgG/HfaB family protein [Cerasicoccus frondis]
MKPILALFTLLAATGTAFADKPTLAIPPVNVSPAIQQSKGNPAEKEALPQVIDSLQSQLLASFGQTGKFNVVSRTDLPPLIQEQTLGQSGNINQNSAAKQGDISGASYVLVVGIDYFNVVSERANFASIAREQHRTMIGVNAVSRLYDANTGVLVASDTSSVDGNDTRQYFAFADREGNLESIVYNKTAQALAQQIASNITADLYPPKVVAKTGKQITINQGSAHGFNPSGAPMLVYAVGGDMIDPDTGESLGQEEVFLGRATILRQDERVTIAILDEDNGVERGHIIRVGN